MWTCVQQVKRGGKKAGGYPGEPELPPPLSLDSDSSAPLAGSTRQIQANAQAVTVASSAPGAGGSGPAYAMDDGGADDLYFEHVGCKTQHRHSRKDKQTWSVKGAKAIQYQVDRRARQSGMAR